MTVFVEEQVPDRNTSEEERFQDDYYSYFESPENTTRYTPSIWFLDEAFKQSSFSLLDLGCGNGALNKYLPTRCNYLGVDHSKAAIQHCKKLYHNQKFITKDLSLVLSELASESQKFDAIVLAGLLFHHVDKETLEQNDDQELVQ